MMALIYYANPTGSEAVHDAIAAGLLGCITTPEQGNRLFPDEWDTIADNGCFSDKWEHRKWHSWLLNQSRDIRFAVAPDVYDPDGGPAHAPTLERWQHYGPMIERHGFTPAFVCQVGCTPELVPDDASVLFLGGTTEWKEGKVAEAITRKAKAEGRWVHMGRVNSLRRLQIAVAWGCDSADGTFVAKAPDTNLPRLLRYLRQANTQTFIDTWSHA
jgi:hypothetical protein